MHTVIVPHLSAYSEYGYDGARWFFRRAVSMGAIPWC
jgi:hypothetical protein